MEFSKNDLNHGYEKSASYYDLFASNDDIPFYKEYAKQQKSPILDLASGTGRVSIPLAQEGYEVVGLELSPAMLEVTKTKYANLPEEVKKRLIFIQGSMTGFYLNQKFNLIILPSSFGHCLTTEQQLSCLSCVREHLTTTGKFILDLYPGGTLKEKGSFTDNPVSIDNKHVITRSGTYTTDLIKQMQHLKLKFQIYEQNRLIEEIDVDSEVAVIFNREINLLLRISGFRILEEYSNWEKVPYEPSLMCERRILVLGKI
ncbi:MAG: class I SAM-dependent methyltransferase [Candidatus Hermodarchaeota archaeon]